MSHWLVGLVLLSVAGVLVGAPARPGPGEIVPFQSFFLKVNGTRWTDRAAQAQAESGFDPLAQSWVVGKDGVRRPCAFGLCQFTLSTWPSWAPKGTVPTNPVASIQAQGKYMPFLEARCAGDFDAAASSYNAGLGSILKAQRLAKALGLPGKEAWLQTALAQVTGPANAKQTQDYVRHIAAFRAAIEKKVKP